MRRAAFTGTSPEAVNLDAQLLTVAAEHAALKARHAALWEAFKQGGAGNPAAEKAQADVLDALGAREFELLNLIKDTPAHTLAGYQAKAVALLGEMEIEPEVFAETFPGAFALQFVRELATGGGA